MRSPFRPLALMLVGLCVVAACGPRATSTRSAHATQRHVSQTLCHHTVRIYGSGSVSAAKCIGLLKTYPAYLKSVHRYLPGKCLLGPPNRVVVVMGTGLALFVDLPHDPKKLRRGTSYYDVLVFAINTNNESSRGPWI